MSVLDLDTDILRDTVAIAEQANNDITEAMNLLNQIVVHDDWICKERNTIKNYTLSNRQKVQELQSNADSFYKAIRQSSELFDEMEQTTLSRINQVDDLLSKIHNVVPTLGTSTAGGSISIASFDNLSN